MSETIKGGGSISRGQRNIHWRGVNNTVGDGTPGLEIGRSMEFETRLFRGGEASFESIIDRAANGLKAALTLRDKDTKE